jgi:uncharacterized OsmC-like protein
MEGPGRETGVVRRSYIEGLIVVFCADNAEEYNRSNNFTNQKYCSIQKAVKNGAPMYFSVSGIG